MAIERPTLTYNLMKYAKHYTNNIKMKCQDLYFIIPLILRKRFKLKCHVVFPLIKLYTESNNENDVTLNCTIVSSNDFIKWWDFINQNRVCD